MIARKYLKTCFQLQESSPCDIYSHLQPESASAPKFQWQTYRCDRRTPSKKTNTTSEHAAEVAAVFTRRTV